MVQIKQGLHFMVPHFRQILNDQTKYGTYTHMDLGKVSAPDAKQQDPIKMNRVQHNAFLINIKTNAPNAKRCGT